VLKSAVKTQPADMSLMLSRAAESFLKRSLAIRENLLERNHVDIAQSLNNLAALYHDLGQCQQAVPLYERALDIRQKVPMVSCSTLVCFSFSGSGIGLVVTSKSWRRWRIVPSLGSQDAMKPPSCLWSPY